MKLTKYDSTPIGPRDFFRKTLRITCWVLPVNVGLLFLLKWSGFEINHTLVYVILAGLFLNNFLALLFYAPLWDRRFADFNNTQGIRLKWYWRVLWGFVVLSPVIGLYFHILFARVRSDTIRWTLRKHLVTALLCSSLAHGLSTLSFRPMLTANFNVSLNYIMKTGIDSLNLFKMKTKHTKSVHEFLEDYQRKHKGDKFSITGQILADAVAALIVFKTKVADQQIQAKDENNLNARLELMESVTSIQQMGFANALKLTYPYGLFVLVGNIELPLLMVCEMIIYTKQQKVFNQTFYVKHRKEMDNFQHNYKQTLSGEKYKYYEKRINAMGDKIESTKLQSSYF